MHEKKTLAELQKDFPAEITFEFLTKQFLALARDRYPSGDKCIQFAHTVVSRASLQDPIDIVQAKIMILSHFRRMVREVDPNYVYHSPKQKDEVYKAIIEGLETLEEDLAELEDEFYEEELLEDDYDEEEEGEELPFDV